MHGRRERGVVVTRVVAGDGFIIERGVTSPFIRWAVRRRIAKSRTNNIGP